MNTIHTNTAEALATNANHFVKVGGTIHAFTDEDACWRFHQAENMVVGSGESSGVAKYYTRRELAA